MSAVNAPDGQSAGKNVAAIVLAVIGVLLLSLGIVYAAVPAGSLPTFFPGYIDGSTGHHALRLAASFVLGAVCLGAAWYVRKGGQSGADSSSTPTETATRE